MDRDLLKNSGWRFASCFTEADAQILCGRIDENHRGDERIYINATQDCSIINPNLDAEPWLEYFSAIPIERENGMFTYARNIRKLHLQIDVMGELSWFELSMANRGFVGREDIDNTQPRGDISIPHESINIFKRWLANRYIAQTFPDEFNRRISGLISKSRSPLIRLFNTVEGKACNSVFISLTPNDVDLGAGESYAIVVVLLFTNEKAEELGYDAIEGFGDQVRAALDATDGIEVDSAVSLAEQDIAYDQLVKMVRWQFDYVSLASGEEIAPVDHVNA